MLPIDPRDGQGSVTPAQPLTHILPAQPMTHGGTTIIRPGAVAWGGLRNARDQPDSSCEAVERSLAMVTRDAGLLPGLLAELARTRLWVPLPARRRPFTDGTAVRLPLVSWAGEDFVPCFTSVGRLTAWAEAAGAPSGGSASAGPAAGSTALGSTAAGSTAAGSTAAGSTASRGPDAGGSGRRWRRAGDARVVPHLVVAAIGLARRLPAGLGLALNPDSAPGLPLYPECVSYLARLTPWERIPPQPGSGRPRPDRPRPDTGMPAATGPPAVLVGHPPAEPAALLRETRDGLRALPAVRHASRAWLSVPGQGEGLVISVSLDNPASETDRDSVTDALARACAALPLRVPFPVHVTFPGESAPDAIDDWIVRNTRPFYTGG